MSGGLFGRTEFVPTTQNYNIDKSIKTGAYNGVLKYETEPLYEDTKNMNDKYSYLLQPIHYYKYIPLKAHTINDYDRTAQPSYGLNASYYNGLIGKFEDMPHGTEVYFPKAYPNHFYNPFKSSPIYLGLTEPAYPL